MCIHRTIEDIQPVHPLPWETNLVDFIEEEDDLDGVYYSDSDDAEPLGDTELGMNSNFDINLIGTNKITYISQDRIVDINIIYILLPYILLPKISTRNPTSNRSSWKEYIRK